VDIIGHYNPRTDPMTLVINGDKARSWLSKGAQPSATVASLLKREGITKPE
jgi:small subunit ribosomal protein S16